MNLKYSFILPALNSESTIRKALNSIEELNNISSHEIIVVDNGSKDETNSIAKEFTEKVYFEPELTIAGLRNFGTKKAKGEFLIFLDSDCVMNSNSLNIILEYFEDNNVGLVGSRLHTFKKSNYYLKCLNLFHLSHLSNVEVNWLPSTILAIRRRLFLDIQGFDEKLVTCEDVDFSYKVKNKGHIIISDKRLAVEHLDEPTSIFDFIKKEYWRGMDTLIVFYKYPKNFSEIKYILTLCYLVLFASLSSVCPIYLFLLVTPVLILSIKSAFKVSSISNFFAFFIFYSLYFISRVAVLPRSLVRLIVYICKR